MAIVSFDGWTVTQWDSIEGFKNGLHIFTLDELQDLAINNTEETQDVTGASGSVLNTNKKNKGCNGTGTNGLLSGGLMEIQTGSKQETKNIVIRHKDTIVVDGEMVSSKTVSIKKDPVGAAGAEIQYVYVKSANSDVVTTYQQALSADVGKFAYATKTITFNEGALTAGDVVTVYYNTKLADDTGVKISNDANKYSGECELVYSGLAKNACGKEACFQFIVPRADFVGNWNLEKGDSQTTHKFEWKSLKNKCAENNSFWDFIIFPDED